MSPADTSPLLRLPNTFRAFYGAFTGLHRLQQLAIDPVLAGRDLILQSATGSGKTEAVLAPCLEKILTTDRTRAVLYIVPTRALALDIRRRFADLLKERLGLHLAIRTGDMKSGVSRPDIILTTPESLDVMLGSAHADIRAFLLRVRTIIIDEVHPLVHQYRGRQLALLMHRLERRTGKPVQRIALSATIADPDAVRRFLDFRRDFVLLTDNLHRQIHPRLLHLTDDEDELVNLLADLAGEWKYNKILIFANSRGRCDKIFGLLNRQGAFQGMALLHYSNLNTRQRQTVEQQFRRQNRAVCVATSTLELGIDVGDVDAVLLFEPPDSVSAFLQRIGRANRRGKIIHFWGICQGARAGEQLLRFLALLRLAGQGRVETARSGPMSSVLSQQIISCLYEKKYLSRAAVLELFSRQPDEAIEPKIHQVFSSLRKKKWLKKTANRGLYKGGYRYWQALLEYRIWSNFPENEEQYQLLVEEKAVADLPKSIVRQIEPGDRVLLAGRRVRIVWIDDGKKKRVLAEPARRLDDKELVWLGKGSHVSYEVARAMRAVLKSAGEKENIEIHGLFSRSRALLSRELEKDGRSVMLDNGIEVLRLSNGSFQYRTFIGAVGNLILSISIREAFAAQEEDIQAIPDEIGVSCSREVRFEDLSLPLNIEDLSIWISRHFKMMATLFPMNSFCTTLPRELLQAELAGFIQDQRLFRFFTRCREKTSTIVRGSPANLHLLPQGITKKEVQKIPSRSEPLLEWEKNRLREPFPLAREDTFQPAALTGTIIGEYFRHRQCQRLLGLQFSRNSKRGSPPLDDLEEAISRQRRERGIAFENSVIAHLHKNNRIFKTIAPRDAADHLRPMADRFSETMACLARLNQGQHPENAYITQPVFCLDAVLRVPGHPPLPAIGIPDLIQVRAGTKDILFFLQVGDIKSSDQPRYFQQWQVAFYAWLLQQLVQQIRDEKNIRLCVADSGFLLNPKNGDDLARRHVFALQPYLASMDAVLHNMETVLALAPKKRFWQLRQHCAGCPGFTDCYQQALTNEDIQFIPGIRDGIVQKMRTLGIHSLGQQEKLQAAFGQGRDKNLLRAIQALQENTVLFKAKNRKKIRTDLFPANISTSCILHVALDPVSARVQTIGLLMEKKDQEPAILTWNATTDSGQQQMWKEFSGYLARLWNAEADERRGPHVLYFGSITRDKLHALAQQMEDRPMEILFAPGRNDHCTDLQQLLRTHFSLPLPGTMTLFALQRILGLMPEAPLAAPESLVHADRFHGTELPVLCNVILSLWQWLRSRLRSQRYTAGWHLQEQTWDLPAVCMEFLAAEKHAREKDIAALMEYTLAERIQRFRALGPLIFVDKRLDEEGRFVSLLEPSADSDDKNSTDRRSMPAKFRAGDFLRLVPLGVTDLQSGLPVILEQYNTKTGQVALSLRRGGGEIFKGISYSLEEDGEDFLFPKLFAVVDKALTKDNSLPMELFTGTLTHEQEEADAHWVQGWLHSEAAQAHLNPSQQQALMLPFRYQVSCINGPPGTGKTHLLGWILIALFRRAQSRGMPLRIAVSAVTHKAIDQVLNKLVTLVHRHELVDLEIRCLKWGRWEGAGFDPECRALQVEPCSKAEKIFSSPYTLVGATGHGFSTMLDKSRKNMPPPFDWVIFDEASQLLVPQALLALIHGQGNFLFLGDVRQLPPIIRSSVFVEERDKEQEEVSFAAEIRCSVLEILLKRYPRQSRQLDITYRMNDVLCRFPSRTWYDGQLHPDPAAAENRLQLTGSMAPDLLTKILDPAKPLVLVGLDHQGCAQEAGEEARLLARLAARLLDHGLGPDQVAILSPHRAQNNAIAKHLTHLAGEEDLPVIDTVERMQGAERDVILFSFTCSDPDLIFSEFLNNPNRFNVVLTRARQKVIIVGSKLFFESVAATEKQLAANGCFKELYRYCRENDCYFQHTEEHLA